LLVEVKKVELVSTKARELDAELLGALNLEDLDIELDRNFLYGALS
jgi:hypothetical protein